MRLERSAFLLLTASAAAACSLVAGTGTSYHYEGPNGSTGGSAACTPKTCAELGAACGHVGDGCGNLLSCGSCPSGETCGAKQPNQCAGGTCTPTTCAAAGKDCGNISDGCTGSLNCGTCPAPQTCGGGGIANVCGGCSIAGGGPCATCIRADCLPEWCACAGNATCPNEFACLQNCVLGDAGTGTGASVATCAGDCGVTSTTSALVGCIDKAGGGCNAECFGGAPVQ
jgi:hypothetical protein